MGGAVNLPHHRRYQWQLVWREYRRPALLALAAIVIALLVVAGESYMTKEAERIEALNAHQSIVADVYRLANMGAPGHTRTDWQEGTNDVER